MMNSVSGLFFTIPMCYLENLEICKISKSLTLDPLYPWSVRASWYRNLKALHHFRILACLVHSSLTEACFPRKNVYAWCTFALRTRSRTLIAMQMAMFGKRASPLDLHMTPSISPSIYTRDTCSSKSASVCPSFEALDSAFAWTKI